MQFNDEFIEAWPVAVGDQLPLPECAISLSFLELAGGRMRESKGPLGFSGGGHATPLRGGCTPFGGGAGVPACLLYLPSTADAAGGSQGQAAGLPAGCHRDGGRGAAVHTVQQTVAEHILWAVQ